MTEQKIVLNLPDDISKYNGQYVVFFSEDKNPKIIFNSFFAEEAYTQAKEIGEKSNRLPVVYRVSNETNIISRFTSNAN